MLGSILVIAAVVIAVTTVLTELSLCRPTKVRQSSAFINYTITVSHRIDFGDVLTHHEYWHDSSHPAN